MPLMGALRHERSIHAQHPDDFIYNLVDLQPIAIARAANACRKRLKNPPKTIEEYLDILSNQGLAISVSALRELLYEV